MRIRLRGTSWRDEEDLHLLRLSFSGAKAFKYHVKSMVISINHLPILDNFVTKAPTLCHDPQRIITRLVGTTINPRELHPKRLVRIQASNSQWIPF